MPVHFAPGTVGQSAAFRETALSNVFPGLHNELPDELHFFCVVPYFTRQKRISPVGFQPGNARLTDGFGVDVGVVHQQPVKSQLSPVIPTLGQGRRGRRDF